MGQLPETPSSPTHAWLSTISFRTKPDHQLSATSTLSPALPSLALDSRLLTLDSSVSGRRFISHAFCGGDNLMDEVVICCHSVDLDQERRGDHDDAHHGCQHVPVAAPPGWAR